MTRIRAAAGTNRAITPSAARAGGLSTKIHAAVDGRGRPLATRYDKHVIVYRGGLVLAALLLRLTDLGDAS